MITIPSSKKPPVVLAGAILFAVALNSASFAQDLFARNQTVAQMDDVYFIARI